MRSFYIKYPDFNSLVGNAPIRQAVSGISLSNKIFVSKYQLYLPDQQQLAEKVKEIMDSK
jgi:hypothetical protein